MSKWRIFIEIFIYKTCEAIYKDRFIYFHMANIHRKHAWHDLQGAIYSFLNGICPLPGLSTPLNWYLHPYSRLISGLDVRLFKLFQTGWALITVASWNSLQLSLPLHSQEMTIQIINWIFNDLSWDRLQIAGFTSRHQDQSTMFVGWVKFTSLESQDYNILGTI